MRLALCRWRAHTPLPPGASAAWEPDFDYRLYPSMGAIDLRPPGGDDSGFCVVGVPDADAPIPGAVVDLGDDVNASLSGQRRTAFANALNLNIEETTVGRVVHEVLTMHARGDGSRWRPLSAERRVGGGRRERVWVGGIKLFDSLGDHLDLEMAYHAESFDKPNSAGLGPDLSWSNATGNWRTLNGEADHSTAVYTAARALHAVGGSNMYAQADVRILQMGLTQAGVCVRMVNNNHIGCYHFVVEESNLSSIAIFDVNNSYTFLTYSTPTINTNTTYTVYGEANGSTISMKVDGSDHGSVTNTIHPSGQHGGLFINTFDSGQAGAARYDNFRTALVGETAPAGSAFIFTRGRFVPGVGGRW